jgi:hypothetical protein
MDAILQEVIHLRNNVRKLAESLLDRLHEIHDAVKDQGEATRESYSAQQAHRNPEPTVVKVIESIVTRKGAADKKQESDYQSLTLFWQKLTFWAVFVYAAITGYQACLTRRAIHDNKDSFEKTLRQMEDAGDDSAIFAGDTLIQMQAQTRAQQKAAGAAKSAADTAGRSLELSERPWVSIDKKSMFITKPLTFSSNNASMYISYSWTNTGHSPAMHIHSKNKLIALSMTKSPEAEAAERQAALCDPLRKIPRWRILEITIFPNDTFPFNEGLSLDQGEIAAGLKSRESGPAAHPGYISLVLIGCVDYQFSFAPGHHQTRYAFNIGSPGPFLMWKGDLKPEGTPPNIKLIYMSQSAD